MITVKKRCCKYLGQHGVTKYRAEDRTGQDRKGLIMEHLVGKGCMCMCIYNTIHDEDMTGGLLFTE